MPLAECLPPETRREEPKTVRFVWTTAGRVRRLPTPGEAKLAESIARLFDREPEPSFPSVAAPSAG